MKRKLRQLKHSYLKYTSKTMIHIHIQTISLKQLKVNDKEVSTRDLYKTIKNLSDTYIKLSGGIPEGFLHNLHFPQKTLDLSEVSYVYVNKSNPTLLSNVFFDTIILPQHSQSLSYKDVHAKTVTFPPDSTLEYSSEVIFDGLGCSLLDLSNLNTSKSDIQSTFLKDSFVDSLKAPKEPLEFTLKEPFFLSSVIRSGSLVLHPTLENNSVLFSSFHLSSGTFKVSYKSTYRLSIESCSIDNLCIDTSSSSSLVLDNLSKSNIYIQKPLSSTNFRANLESCLLDLSKCTYEESLVVYLENLDDSNTVILSYRNCIHTK